MENVTFWGGIELGDVKSKKIAMENTAEPMKCSGWGNLEAILVRLPHLIDGGKWDHNSLSLSQTLWSSFSIFL